MTEFPDVTEQEVAVIQRVAVRVGTDGINAIVAAAWDDDDEGENAEVPGHSPGHPEKPSEDGK